MNSDYVVSAFLGLCFLGACLWGVVATGKVGNLECQLEDEADTKNKLVAAYEAHIDKLTTEIKVDDDLLSEGGRLLEEARAEVQCLRAYASSYEIALSAAKRERDLAIDDLIKVLKKIPSRDSKGKFRKKIIG